MSNWQVEKREQMIMQEIFNDPGLEVMHITSAHIL